MFLNHLLSPCFIAVRQKREAAEPRFAEHKGQFFAGLTGARRISSQLISDNTAAARTDINIYLHTLEKTQSE